MILLLVVASFMTSVLAQEVSIPDTVLNGAIRQALGTATGDITVQDIESLRELDVSWNTLRVGGTIQSLKGLESAKNLTSLNLRGGWVFFGIKGIELTDFSPLAGRCTSFFCRGC